MAEYQINNFFQRCNRSGFYLILRVGQNILNELINFCFELHEFIFSLLVTSDELCRLHCDVQQAALGQHVGRPLEPRSLLRHLELSDR